MKNSLTIWFYLFKVEIYDILFLIEAVLYLNEC